MKRETFVSVSLIALGVAGFAYQGVIYTTHGRGMDLGPVRVGNEQSRHTALPPILGAIALISGFALLLVDKAVVPDVRDRTRPPPKVAFGLNR